MNPPCPTHARATDRCRATRAPRPFGCGRIEPPCPGHDRRGDPCGAGTWRCARREPPCEGHRRPGLVCGDAPRVAAAPHAPLVVGLNLPWSFAFCGYDFGVPPSGWRARCPSPRDFDAEIGDALREARAAGIAVLRFFVLADALTYPENERLDAFVVLPGARSGKSTELEQLRGPIADLPRLTDAFVADLRSLLDACHAIGLRCIPSFVSFEAFFPPVFVADGTVKHGRGSLLLGPGRRADDAHLRALFAATLDRLLAIGGGAPHPAVLAWELVNEPDWCVRKGHVSGAAMSRFVLAGVERIVQAGYTASVGFVRADVDWMTPDVKGRLVELAKAGKYLHQLHYYPHASGDRLPPSASTWFGERTIVGEMASNDTPRARWFDPEVRATEADPERYLLGRLEHVARQGYRIALLWSRNASDDKSGFDASIRRQVRAFVEAEATRNV